MLDKAVREAITLVSDEEVGKLGRHHSSAALDAQAGATLELAKRADEKTAIEKEIGEKLIPAAETVRALVKATGDERVVGEGSSKGKTVAQGTAVRAAKEWRRKALKAFKNLVIRGLREAAGETKITAGDNSLPNLSKEVKNKAALLKSYAPKALVPATATALAESGVKVAADLDAANSVQEVEWKNLPLKTQEEYIQKGVLLCALKLINNAGWTVHASNLKSAGRFNLEILYRADKSTGGDKGKGGGGGTTPPGKP